MTTEDSKEILGLPEIRSRYLRVLRIVCCDGDEDTCCRIILFTEERSIEERPRAIDEQYLLKNSGVRCIGASTILAYAENDDVNDAAQSVYNGLLGRMGTDKIFQLIERLVSGSQALALAVPKPV